MVLLDEEIKMEEWGKSGNVYLVSLLRRIKSKSIWDEQGTYDWGSTYQT